MNEAESKAAATTQETYFLFKEKIFDEKKFSTDDDAIKAAKDSKDILRIERQRDGKVIWTKSTK